MYKIEGRSVISDKGKAVASLSAENVVVFETGMAPAHKNKFCAWLRENGLTFGNLPEPETETAAAVPAAPAQNIPDSAGSPAIPDPEPKEESAVKALVIEDIPDDLLPAFDRRLGMDTPRLREYIKHHNLDAAQTVALIRRLERKK